MQLSAELAAEEPSLERVALANAFDHRPGLDTAKILSELDRLAAPIAGATGPGEVIRHVYGTLELGIAEDYDDPRSTLLDEVLASRRGTPVALAVVLIAIARRAGVQLLPISFPGHFLVRAPGGPFIDPADGRHPLPEEALLALAREAVGGSEREAVERLEPVGARAVAVRLLVNLQRALALRGDHARALLVADRLFDSTGAAMHLVDRAAHALALGAARAAVSDFERYLDEAPGAADAKLVRQVLDKARAFAGRPSN
jgi:regulator of sirC expression with transglutaminase-like and TPR domain